MFLSFCTVWVLPGKGSMHVIPAFVEALSVYPSHQRKSTHGRVQFTFSEEHHGRHHSLIMRFICFGVMSPTYLPEQLAAG